MKYRSGILPAMFLLSAFFLPLKPVMAWNPDIAYDLPKQRRMCVKRTKEEKILFTSITMEEDCPPGTRRYIVVFGKEPHGSIALLPTTTSQRFYPPLVLSWPDRQGFHDNPLWHFTCVKIHEITLLESKISLMGYKGEITSNGNKDCLEAEQRALKYCQEEWKGEDLLEKCPLSWGM